MSPAEKAWWSRGIRRLKKQFEKRFPEEEEPPNASPA